MRSEGLRRNSHYGSGHYNYWHKFSRNLVRMLVLSPLASVASGAYAEQHATGLKGVALSSIGVSFNASSIDSISYVSRIPLVGEKYPTITDLEKATLVWDESKLTMTAEEIEKISVKPASSHTRFGFFASGLKRFGISLPGGNIEADEINQLYFGENEITKVEDSITNAFGLSRAKPGQQVLSLKEILYDKTDVAQYLMSGHLQKRCGFPDGYFADNDRDQGYWQRTHQRVITVMGSENLASGMLYGYLFGDPGRLPEQFGLLGGAGDSVYIPSSKSLTLSDRRDMMAEVIGLNCDDSVADQRVTNPIPLTRPIVQLLVDQISDRIIPALKGGSLTHPDYEHADFISFVEGLAGALHQVLEVTPTHSQAVDRQLNRQLAEAINAIHVPGDATYTP